MVFALPAEPLPIHAGALWSRQVEAAESVAHALQQRQALTEAQRRLYEIVENLGAWILDVGDVTELSTRLYEGAVDPRLLRWERQALQDLDEAPGADEMERGFASALGTTRLAQECALLLATRLAAVFQVAAAADSLEIDLESPHDLQGIVEDFRTPPVVRSLLQETLAGEVAFLALLAPLMDADRWPCPPWLHHALLEQVRSSSMAHLRLLSLIPGAAIPEDVLPLDEHLEVAAIDREWQERARFALPAELPVGDAYVEGLRAELEDCPPTPAGVRAIFEG